MKKFNFDKILRNANFESLNNLIDLLIETNAPFKDLDYVIDLMAENINITNDEYIKLLDKIKDYTRQGIDF